MAKQFDIVENLDPATRDAYPYLVVLQHDRAESVSTVVTAPLALPGRQGAPRMHPRIEVNGQRYVILVAQLAAIPRNELGRSVASAELSRYEIIAALDMLFTGI